MIISSVFRVVKAMHAYLGLLWLSLVLPDSSPKLSEECIDQKIPYLSLLRCLYEASCFWPSFKQGE